jgi:hypothetical protein
MITTVTKTPPILQKDYQKWGISTPTFFDCKELAEISKSLYMGKT